LFFRPAFESISGRWLGDVTGRSRKPEDGEEKEREWRIDDRGWSRDGSRDARSGAHHIDLQRVTESAEKAFAILPRKTKRFYIGETEFRDGIANALKIALVELAIRHCLFRPIDELSERQFVAQIGAQLIRHGLTCDFHRIYSRAFRGPYLPDTLCALRPGRLAHCKFPA